MRTESSSSIILCFGALRRKRRNTENTNLIASTNDYSCSQASSIWWKHLESTRYSHIPAFLSWRIHHQSSTKNDQRPVRITGKRCLYAYMRNWSPCINSAELQEFSDFHVMTQETTKSVMYLKGLESYSAIPELAPCLPSYYSNKWSLTAGIWFSLSFIRSIHKAPCHWRARGLCERTSSFLKVSK